MLSGWSVVTVLVKVAECSNFSWVIFRSFSLYFFSQVRNAVVFCTLKCLFGILQLPVSGPAPGPLCWSDCWFLACLLQSRWLLTHFFSKFCSHNVHEKENGWIICHEETNRAVIKFLIYPVFHIKSLKFSPYLQIKPWSSIHTSCSLFGSACWQWTQALLFFFFSACFGIVTAVVTQVCAAWCSSCCFTLLQHLTAGLCQDTCCKCVWQCFQSILLIKIVSLLFALYCHCSV